MTPPRRPVGDRRPGFAERIRQAQRSNREQLTGGPALRLPVFAPGADMSEDPAGSRLALDSLRLIMHRVTSGESSNAILLLLTCAWEIALASCESPREAFDRLLDYCAALGEAEDIDVTGDPDIESTPDGGGT